MSHKLIKVDLDPMEISEMYSQMDADGSGHLDFGKEL